MIPISRRAVSSYLTLFTLTKMMAVSSLWYFPYPHGRSPLATTVSCAARTFLLEVSQATVFQAQTNYITPLISRQNFGQSLNLPLRLPDYSAHVSRE